MVTGRISFVFLVVMLASVSSAQAAPLNLVLQTPDITSNFTDVAYDSVTDSLSANGFASSLDGSPIAGGTFTLSADISAGGILNSGTIAITGTSGIYNSGTLISGSLTEVGFGANEVLEFLFDPTGGDLFAAYTGRRGGIILSASGYNGDEFNSNFASAPFNAFSDTAPVPVPAALWLFGSGLLGLMGLAKRAKT